MDHEVPYDELDPGIAATVRWLNEAGFVTVDSGDGVTKLAAGAPEPCCHVNPVPHVHIKVPVTEAPETWRRLSAAMEARGLAWHDMSEDDDALDAAHDVVWQSVWEPLFDADHIHVLLSGWSLSTLPREAA